jgi:hypothetical protein
LLLLLIREISCAIYILFVLRNAANFLHYYFCAMRLELSRVKLNTQSLPFCPKLAFLPQACLFTPSSAWLGKTDSMRAKRVGGAAVA